MKKVAITGSSGFIGKQLLDGLVEKGYDICEIDISKGIDLTNWKVVRGISYFDIIVHLAGKSFVPDSFIAPREFYFNNQVSTINVLELAKFYSASVIFFSSYLYGSPEYLPIDENHPLRPNNPYSQTKLICEKICEGYNRDFGIPITIFRPFNVYGKGQKSEFLIPSIIDQMQTGIITLKDPRPKRDFIHVYDVVRAIIQVIEQFPSKLEIFNLGYGESYSVEEIVKIITSKIKGDLKIEYINEFRKGEILNTIADISKIESIIGWKPQIGINEGLSTLLQMPDD